MSLPSEIEASISNGSREKKLTRKQRRRRESPTPVEDDLEAITSSIPSSLTIIPPSMAATRLLVCSIGNPAPYINTLHSAGHTVLNTLAVALAYPSFQKSRAYGNGLVSPGSEFTLWQSTSLMNISGAGVSAAWRQFVKECRGEEPRLVVVHDELELGLGQVKVKSGSASAKGHNGLKSIREALGERVDYMRIGVGIGRPESREANVVAGYVLRKMTGVERGKIEGCVGVVERELRRLSEG
jgi:PTH1 family peptidyl-tRNA hydrolase